MDKKFKQAPFFYWLYTSLIVAGAGVVLLLKRDQLVPMTILSPGAQRSSTAVRAVLHA